MAEITKMKSQQLKNWIKSLEHSLRTDTDDINQKIYKKWLDEAKAEQQARLDRKENYLASQRR